MDTKSNLSLFPARSGHPLFQTSVDSGSEWTMTVDLPEVIRVLMFELPNIESIRLLTRPGRMKAFVVVSERNLDRDYMIANRLCQVRDIRPGEVLDYDVVPSDRAVLIPADAETIYPR